jgi:hypothetical protein
MRSRFVVGLCLTTCLSTPAAAERWYTIGTTSESIDYADADSVGSNGGTTSLQLLRAFGGNETNPAGYVRIGVEIACSSGQLRVVSSTRYDTSKTYLSTDETDMSWEAIGSGTVADFARRFACEGALHETFVSDPWADAEEYWYYYYEY